MSLTDGNMANVIKAYRELIPESNYKECDGCHTGKKRCTTVHYIHSDCPCSTCIVKTSCTDYCDDYIYATGHAITKMKHSGIHINLENISHKGYSITFKIQEQRYKMTHTLHRWMNNQDRVRINSNLQGVL